ncbi:MAG: MalY/PatB family protein [Sutterellaceae bacterium]|nr:MalY/PatB family protein [Sutterellaceae bacterium]
MQNAFDFDKLIDRVHSDSFKWGDARNEDAIPMWVADMDFETAPVVKAAVQKRAEHGAFGYVLVPDSYYQAMHTWYKTRHNWEIDPKSVIVTTGVVPAVSAVIKALVPQGASVILQTPAYNCFFTCITNNGCKVLENPLKKVDGYWRMDFDDLKEKVKEAKFFLLCNPHNPVGRSWSEEELTELARICKEAGVTVLSDEIHCEFVFGQHKHTAFASLPKEIRPTTVVATSGSKAFNTASLQNAFIVAEDAYTYNVIERAINVNEICDVNGFGVAAMTAAWSEGGPWLDALCAYLEENDRALRQVFAEVLGDDLKKFPMTPLEATYLEWIDCRVLNVEDADIEEELKKVEKVRITHGSHYGKLMGTGFIRINIACPRERLLEGAKRIATGLKRLLNKSA